MDDKRNAILLDLWQSVNDVKDLEKEIAELKLESEKSYFKLLKIDDMEDSKKYLENKSESLELYKQSLDSVFLQRFEKFEKVVSNLSDEQVEEYISTFLEKI